MSAITLRAVKGSALSITEGDNNFSFLLGKLGTITTNAIDCSSGTAFAQTISGATTFTVTNVEASGIETLVLLRLTNGGSSVVTWFSGVKWAAGTAPTLTTSGVDYLGFLTTDGGTTWYGFVLAKALA
jgi:hypothetical protein